MSLYADVQNILDSAAPRERMLDLARLYVSLGWYVFPLASGSKVPPSRADLGIPAGDPAGLSIASCKADDIEAWWGEHPDWNIGIACGPSGLVILDADLYKDGTAEVWAKLAVELGMLETFTVRTTSGGCHHYLNSNGSEFSCRNDWRPAIDCKSVGGYVVAPGSQVDGTQYLPESDLNIIDVPPRWAAALPTRSTPPAATTTQDRTSRHNRLVKLAWELAPAMPRAEALEYVEDFARGVGLDKEHRLREARAAVESAYTKREDAHKDALDDAALGRVDLSAVTQPDAGTTTWYVNDFLPESSMVLIAARWKTGKTFVFYSAVLEMLSGRKVFGTFPVERDDLRVLIWQFEMPQVENIRRLRKLALGMGLKPQQITDWQNEGRLVLYAQSPLSLKASDDVKIFHNRVDTFDPHIILIDSAGEAGFTISSNEEVRAELRAVMNALTKAGRCPVILTHMRKSQQGAKKDDEGDAIIGAQSWAAKASRIYSLQRIGEDAAPGDFVVKLASHRGWGLVQTPELFLRVRDVEVAPDGGEGFEAATRIDPMDAAEVKESGVEKPINQAKRLLLEAIEKLQLPRRKNLIEALEDEGITKTTAARAYREMLGKQILKGPEGVIRRGR